MAFEMAKKGMNVLLISRTESKLVDAEAELKSACPSVSVEHLAIDYSNFDASLQVHQDEQKRPTRRCTSRWHATPVAWYCCCCFEFRNLGPDQTSKQWTVRSPELQLPNHHSSLLWCIPC